MFTNTKIKVRSLEAKLFAKYGSENLVNSDINARLATDKFKKSFDTSIFILFSGFTIACSLLALSQLLSGFSNVALYVKSVVDLVNPFISTAFGVSVAFCGIYMAPKLAELSFARWDQNQHMQALLLESSKSLSPVARRRTPSPVTSQNFSPFAENDIIPENSQVEWQEVTLPTFDPVTLDTVTSGAVPVNRG